MQAIPLSKLTIVVTLHEAWKEDGKLKDFIEWSLVFLLLVCVEEKEMFAQA